MQQHKGIIKKRPPLPKQIDTDVVLTCHNVKQVDSSHVLSTYSNNFLRNILNKVSLNLLEPRNIFAKKANRPKSCFKSNSNTSI
jgi:hypothetical protein